MCDDIKRGGAGRGWSQVSWTSKSPLGSRKSRYVQFECVCAPVWESVSQCERGCPTVGRCVPLWEGVWDVCVCACVCVSLPRVFTVAELMCVGMRDELGVCPVGEHVSNYGRVCPSVGGCATAWEDVPQCWRVCPSVREGVSV